MNEELRILGEEDALEFMENGEEHIFSAEYNARKDELLGAERTRRKKPIKLVLLIAALVTLSAMTVTAAARLINVSASKNEETGTYTYTILREENVGAVGAVEIAVNYIPDGYAECPVCGQNKFQPIENNDHRGGFSVASVNGASELTVPFVSSVERLEIGGVRAELLTHSGMDNDHTLLLFHEEDGQIIEIISAKDISVDTLYKIAENITYTVTDSPAAEYRQSDAVGADESLEDTLRIEDCNIISVGDAINGKTGDAAGMTPCKVSCTVKSARVLDTLPNGLNADDFCINDGMEPLETLLNTDGTFKTRTREVSYWENNAAHVRTETAEVKIFELVLEVKNDSDNNLTDVFMGDRLEVLKEKDGALAIDVDSRYKLDFLAYDAMPFYFDRTDYPGGKHVYFMDIGAKETKEARLLYTVDEDALADTYVSFNPEGPEPAFLKIQ